MMLNLAVLTELQLMTDRLTQDHIIYHTEQKL